MGLFNLIFRLGTDNTDFNRGLDEAKTRATRAAGTMQNNFERHVSRISGNWVKAAVGFFAGRQVMQLGREMLQEIRTVDELAKRFNLTTTQVQQLQQEAEETGRPFEDLVKNADELERILSRISDRPVLFNTATMQNLARVEQILKGFQDSVKEEEAKIIQEPSLLLARMFSLVTPFGVKGRAAKLLEQFEHRNDPALMTGAMEAKLERDALAARTRAAETGARERVARMEKELDRLRLTPEELIANLEKQLREMAAKFGGGPNNAREKEQMLAVEMEIERARARLANQPALADTRLARNSDALLSVGNFLGGSPDSRLQNKLDDQLRELQQIRTTLERQSRNVITIQP